MSIRGSAWRWVALGGLWTLVGLAAFAGFLAWVAPRLKGKSAAELQQEGCVSFLDGIARQVRTYAERKGRLPATLADLRDPEIGSQYDAEPWDCWSKPIEYRVLDAGDQTFQLRSCGPDLQPGTPDDILWPSDAVWK